MKKFLKFSVSIFCISLLTGCPPFASLEEANHIEPNNNVQDTTPEFDYQEAYLI